MTKENYQEYLKSNHWDNVRNAMRNLKKTHKCELCGNVNEVLEVHHISYEHIGNERQDDLVVLCHSCHDRVHSSGLKLKIVQDKVRKNYYDTMFDCLLSGRNYDEAVRFTNDLKNDDYRIQTIGNILEKTMEDMQTYYGFCIIYR